MNNDHLPENDSSSIPVRGRIVLPDQLADEEAYIQQEWMARQAPQLAIHMFLIASIAYLLLRLLKPRR